MVSLCYSIQTRLDIGCKRDFDCGGFDKPHTAGTMRISTDSKGNRKAV